MISCGRVSVLCPKTISFSERTGLIHTCLPLTLLKTHTRVRSHTHTAPHRCHNAVLLPRNSKPWVHVSPYLVTRAAHNGRKDGAGGVISCEASFAQARAIVTHERGGLFFTHGECGRVNQGLEHLGNQEKSVVGHFSKPCWRRSWLWGLTPSATRT